MASSLEKSVRVIKIVAKLFGYIKLKSSDLAEEFDVSIKTIQRDLKLIAEVLPLKSNRGLWWLDRNNIKEQKLAYELIKSFSQNAGLDIECLQDSKDSLSLISFAIAYESIDENIAKKIIDSIKSKLSCRFFYTNNKGKKSQKVVSPILIFTQSGIWYLVAKENSTNIIKKYSFEKIKLFETLDSVPSIATAKDIKEAKKHKNIWYSSDKEPFVVELFVDKYAYGYIQNNPLHFSQSIKELLVDGGAILTYEITNSMELLPKIKEWIPYITILEPNDLKKNLIDELNEYLGASL